MNKSVTFALAALSLVGVGALVTLRKGPWQATAALPPATLPAPLRNNTLRLGLIPERDVFTQRKAYQQFAEYLATHHIGPDSVELRTSSSYAGALQDLEEGETDIAFVGSLVAVLAHERCGADVLLKSETPAGTANYTGVIFVRQDSPAKEFSDLLGQRIGGVKTTTAGAVYPLYLIRQLGWAATDVPSLIWTGTHDDVMAEVAAGTLDAGAVKDSRFAAYTQAHPQVHFRKLSTSAPMPNNALVVRHDLPAPVKEKLVQLLLAMDQDPQAANVLRVLEIKRFVKTDLSEYAALYDMIDLIGPAWFAMDVGPAPKRPPEAVGGGNGGGGVP